MTGYDIKVSVFPLSWKDLAAVPVEQKALYVCLCFVVSELNSLQRLTLLSLKEYTDNALHERAARIQSNTLIRVYSSKCFEIQNFIKTCIAKAKDPIVKDIVVSFDKHFYRNNLGKGYQIAHHLRNKIGFHLDLREAIKSTRRADKNIDCNLYIQERDGNCFFPVGEDILQGEGFWGAAPEAAHAISSEDDHSAWVDWTISTHAIVKEMHGDVFERFVLPCLPKPLGDPEECSVSDDLVGCYGHRSLPLFLCGTK